MPINLPSGLAGLLARMASAKPGEAQGKADAKGMKGKTGEAKKGEGLGEDSLLAGMGFDSTDKAAGKKKNVFQDANVSRFLRDPKGEMKKTAKDAKQAEAKETPAEAKETPAEAKAETAEAREGHDAMPREAKKEERAEEAREHGQEAAEQKEAREAHEAKDPQQQQQQDREEEEGKGAHAWANDDPDAEEGDERRGIGTSQFDHDDATRCHGFSLDGSRCVRRPLDGCPFCAEHKATRIAGPDEV